MIGNGWRAYITTFQFGSLFRCSCFKITRRITWRSEEKEDIFQPLLLKPWLLLFIFTRKFLLLTDRVYSAFQSLQFIRGLQGFTDTSPSTVFVRGNRWPNYQEVVTRYPLCGSSELLYSVGCIQGQSTLSFGLIVPDNRYVMHHLIPALPHNSIVAYKTEWEITCCWGIRGVARIFP